MKKTVIKSDLYDPSLCTLTSSVHCCMYILAQNFALPLALPNTASFCLEKAHKLTVINEKARK